VGAGASFIDAHPFKGNPGVITNPSYLTAWRPNLQGGFGINLKINQTISIQLSNILNMPLDDSWDGLIAGSTYDIYLQHSAALVFTFKKKTDSDHDGVKDEKDECPNTPAGTKVDKRGCPEPEKDSDGDGVLDSRDKCPNTGRGVKVDYFGCPVTITNPVVTTQTNNNTAPQPTQTRQQPAPPVNTQPVIIDTDGDGLPDTDDKCPTVPGPVSNYGCPEIKEEVSRRMEYAMHNINFETNSAVILKTSYPVLDDVVVLLNQFTEYDLHIGGHTDSRGDDNYNNRLSRNRAAAVKNILLKKASVLRG